MQWRPTNYYLFSKSKINLILSSDSYWFLSCCCKHINKSYALQCTRTHQIQRENSKTFRGHLRRLETLHRRSLHQLAPHNLQEAPLTLRGQRGRCRNIKGDLQIFGRFSSPRLRLLFLWVWFSGGSWQTQVVHQI